MPRKTRWIACESDRGKRYQERVKHHPKNVIVVLYVRAFSIDWFIKDDRDFMSLTWHLRNHLESPAGDYLQHRFSHPKRITLSVNKHLQWSGKLLPSTPYCPFGTLASAINYRIRYSFAITPAHDLPAWRGAFEHLAWN